MKREHDFSKGVRGKFYNAGAEFNLPNLYGKSQRLQINTL